MYNYAKIETLVNKEEINDVVLNATYILSTVKFNHNVIKILLDEDYFVNKEEKYEDFISQKPSEDFIREESTKSTENEEMQESEKEEN